MSELGLSAVCGSGLSTADRARTSGDGVGLRSGRVQKGKMRNEGEKQQGAESETPAKGHVDMARGLWGVSLDPAAPSAITRHRHLGCNAEPTGTV